MSGRTEADDCQWVHNRIARDRGNKASLILSEDVLES